MNAFFDLLKPASPGETGTSSVAVLDDLRPFLASGADAASFLHGQLTNDVTGLGSGDARLAGYCTAKGRLLATLVLWRAEAPAPEPAPVAGFMRSDIFDTVIKRLSMFIMRSKVKLVPFETSVMGVTVGPQQDWAALQEATSGALPQAPYARVELASGTWIRAPQAGDAARFWWIATDAQLDFAGMALSKVLHHSNSASWRGADLAAGIPWIGSRTQDTFIPQTVNLDLIQGVSFTKGCYPGQEVVARSHYRGTVKRRMAYGTVAEASADAAELAGIDIYDADQPDEPCGRVVDAAPTAPLGLLFEITLASLPGGALRLGAPDGPAIAVHPLPYPLA